jgi:hypothetical protein
MLFRLDATRRVVLYGSAAIIQAFVVNCFDASPEIACDWVVREVGINVRIETFQSKIISLLLNPFLESAHLSL